MFGNDRTTMFFQSDDVSLNGGESEPAAQPKPEETWQYWKSKYDGSTGFAKQVVTERDRLKQQLFDLQQQLEGQIAEKETTLSNLQHTLAEKEKALADQLAANQRYAKQAEIRSILHSKYRQLVEDFDEGVLRVDGLEGDELTAYLDKYAARHSARLAQAREDGIQEVVGGAAKTPQAPASNAQISEADLYKTLMTAAPGSKEYQEAWALYEKANEDYKIPLASREI